LTILIAKDISNNINQMLYGEWYEDRTSKWEIFRKGIASDGAEIYASYGGCSDDIYRHEVQNNEKKKVGNIEEEWNYISIKKDGEEIFSYND